MSYVVFVSSACKNVALIAGSLGCRYQRLVGLKRERPHLRVMLSVGGWDMGSNEFTSVYLVIDIDAQY